jgi:Ca2+-binding RTX toxin-like protein
MGGNDTLLGAVGGHFDGGDGDDLIQARGGLVGGAGNDSMVGSDFDDTFTGGPGSDTMLGGAGNDNFFQGGDNDGQDVIDGGAGFDWFIGGSTGASAIVLDLAAGTVTGGGAGGAGSATLTGIEAAHGTPFDDRLTGDAGDNVLFGNEGNDTIRSSGGVDTIAGGSGTDTFIFAATPGSANADSVSDFTSGVDQIRLDATVMTALGASGNFAAGDARFFAGAGANAGHDADDRVVYDTSSGNLWYDADGSGTSTAQLVATLLGAPGLSATDIAVDNGSTPTPTPTPGTSINGTNGADTLVGGSGNDTIFGNSGNDWIEGRGGNDQLSGGSGQDSYVFREFGAGNADTLLNFDSNWDAMRFDSGAFGALGGAGHFAAGDARFFAGAGASAGHDADDRIVYNTSTGQLYYDADGAGGADAQLVATVQGAGTLAAPDIWVI